MPPSSLPTPLPLVGRAPHLREVEAFLEASSAPTVLVLEGPRGAGKSRLAEAAARRAGDEEWTVLRGHAYAVESGIPYALLTDAFSPLMGELGPQRVDALSRGGAGELARVFPTLGAPLRGANSAAAGGAPDELGTRLLWTFVQFLQGLGERRPVLVVVEDLQWADDASLQVLHFAARQVGGHRVRFLATHADDGVTESDRWREVSRSLKRQGLVRGLLLPPLTGDDLRALLARGFDTEERVVMDFAARLHAWTLGNPYYVTETLRALVDSGQLHQRDGSWYGWEARRFELPPSVRELARGRVEGLSPAARRLADRAAVLGTRVGLAQLRAVAGLDDETLLESLDELSERGVMAERVDGVSVEYDFRHPMLREALYDDLGGARRRTIHGEVARDLEAWYGARASRHADELALHFSRAPDGGRSAKAARYLLAAGEAALSRHANREAARYLEGALERLDADDAPARHAAAVGLARAHNRLGAYDEAIRLWRDVVARLERGPDADEARRRIATALLGAGRPAEARAALEPVDPPGDRHPDLVSRVHLTRAAVLQELGAGPEALEEMQQALRWAETAGRLDLQARAHRSLGLLHLWTGPPERSAACLERGLDLATRAQAPRTTFWCHWGLAVLAGVRGRSEELDRHLEQARRTAEELQSPVLRLWVDEVAMQRAFGRGDWETAAGLGEGAIELARALNQRTLLSRLLVVTAGVHLGRDEHGRAHELVAEAGALARVDDDGGDRSLHLILPALVGRTHLHLARREYGQAIRVGARGLELARGSGFVYWALQWLSPLVVEAHLWLEDADGAEAEGARVGREAEALDHALGRAWARACDAMVVWKRGDPVRGAALMTEAAEALEAVPMIPHAARVRRQLAGRFDELGQRREALRELRRVHELFRHMGWEFELEKTRAQFRQIGSRPPPRDDHGPGGLSDRELEVALAVAGGASNKAAARALGISPRTVSTHLSHIYRKLNVSSRTELTTVLADLGIA